MRVTAVPAQVTTVEDRVMGNLGMGQLVLLFTPVIVDSSMYAALPPEMHIAPYKLVLSVLLLLLCGALAIRIKGKIMLLWAVVLLRYILRPHCYVYDKRSVYGRNQYRRLPEVSEDEATEVSKEVRKVPTLTFEDMAKAQAVIEDPATNVAFETRKGGLYVHIMEIK